MIQSIVICTDEDSFYTGHPVWTGPFHMGNEKLRVGDRIYYSPTIREWVKDHEIKFKQEN